ncbi:MAG: hypothetical protein PHS37_02195 [Candidatus Omnitrophica bacterium]|nr:hypothetical protein [Candidatus Omnitrophota bacterium]
MPNFDLKKFAIGEAALIASCVAMAFGLGWLGKFIPGIGKAFFSIKLAGILYIASIAFRVAGFFIRMTCALAFMIAAAAVVLLILAARYPAFFSFLK